MANKKKARYNKRYIFFIILVLSLFLSFSKDTGSFYCANPLSEINLCDNITFSHELSLELCCPESEYYGETKSYPTSKDDCIANFFSENIQDLGEKCDMGCCLDLYFMSCSSYTPRSYCEGIISTRFSGSCTKIIDEKKYYVIGACEEGCCCKETGFNIDTKGACEDGVFNPDIQDIRLCSQECKSIACMDGRQSKRPLFCKDERLYNDCTGGDGTAGNENDCGCPSGQVCKDDGRCTLPIKPESYPTKQTCLDHGFNWYEDGKRCVGDCSNCKTDVILQENVYIDPCKGIKCGENSACDLGRCKCDKGFTDDSCRLLETNIDYDASGCVSKDPCKTGGGVGRSFLWAIFVFFLIVMIILFIKFRNNGNKPENPPNNGSYQENPYQNYPYGYQR